MNMNDIQRAVRHATEPMTVTVTLFDGAQSAIAWIPAGVRSDAEQALFDYVHLLGGVVLMPEAPTENEFGELSSAQGPGPLATLLAAASQLCVALAGESASPAVTGLAATVSALIAETAMGE